MCKWLKVFAVSDLSAGLEIRVLELEARVWRATQTRLFSCTIASSTEGFSLAKGAR